MGHIVLHDMLIIVVGTVSYQLVLHYQWIITSLVLTNECSDLVTVFAEHNAYSVQPFCIRR